MTGNNVLGIIYSNAYDECLGELTSVRTMGSVPFAARYRLIDFVLSGMVNCGITKVGVLTDNNYRSLMDHLGNGLPWDLSRKREGMTILPPFNNAGVVLSGSHAGRLSTLSRAMGYISRSNKEYVLLSDCNLVCNPDYGRMISEHIDSGADITLAYKNGKLPNLANTMVLNLEGSKVNGVTISPSSDGEVSYCVNTMIMKRSLLEQLVNGALSHNGSTFEADIIQRNTKYLDIRGFEVDCFLETIDSLQSYYNVSMELINGSFRELFSRDRLIYTKVRDYMPAIYGIGCDVTHSLVADGCIIKGKVENSILFRGVRIDEGAVVRNSIVMQDTYIGADAKINCSILDKGVVIKPGRELSGAPTYPMFIGKNIVV